MNIEIIIIGNELLQGKIHDKNSPWLGKFLLNKGLKLNYSTIIQDSKASIEEALKLAMTRSDIIITTGGLGPTQDDITKATIANFFNKKVEPSKQALAITQKQYQQYGREYNGDKHHYHLFPEDFEVVFNPAGFAPGLKFSQNNKTVISLPGVPKEFQAMISETLHDLFVRDTDELFEAFTIKTFKLPEARIFQEIAPDLWDKLSAYGDVSSLPHPVGVDIGVFLTGSRETIEQSKKEIIKIVEATELKPNIYHYGPESIEEVLVKKASAKGLTLGSAESCTGGLVASRITDISGSSAIFWGSIVSYDNSVKENSLGVQAETLKQFGAVSEETAAEMAKGACEKLNVDLAVSTTGIAGPGGGSEEKPVGTICVGVHSKRGTRTMKFNYRGDRESLKYRFSQVALVSLIEEIDAL